MGGSACGSGSMESTGVELAEKGAGGQLRRNKGREAAG
jgi:hypothetical protein